MEYLFHGHRISAQGKGEDHKDNEEREEAWNEEVGTARMMSFSSSVKHVSLIQE
jgi:hypothetical protein